MPRKRHRTAYFFSVYVLPSVFVCVCASTAAVSGVMLTVSSASHIPKTCLGKLSPLAPTY